MVHSEKVSKPNIYVECGSEENQKCYARFFERRFIMSPISWMMVMDPREFTVLTFLCNWGKLHGEVRYDGWFFCPVYQIVYAIKGMNRQSQWRTITNLESKGFIEVESRPLLRKTRQGKRSGTQRWIRINFVKIQDAVMIETVKKSCGGDPADMGIDGYTYE